MDRQQNTRRCYRGYERDRRVCDRVKLGVDVKKVLMVVRESALGFLLVEECIYLDIWRQRTETVG